MTFQKYIGYGLAAAALFAVLPIGPSFDLRNDLAFKAMTIEARPVAKAIYGFGKWQNDPLAANNWLVLDYHHKRYSPNLSKAEKKAAREKMWADLKALRPEKLGAAEYNLALFNYRCSTKSKCFNIGLERFETAARLGDPLAETAALMMKRRKIPKSNKTARLAMEKQAADNGDPWHAYQYARDVYRDDPAAGQAYGLIAAESGLADAQAFMGRYFEREDSVEWLTKAATNPVNRSLMAARELGKHYESTGDHESSQKWYAKAAEPREDFQFALVIRKDGFRWRSLQNSRAADANTSNSSAYSLGLAAYKSGASLDSVLEYMRKAALVGWGDSALITAELTARQAPRHAQKLQAKTIIQAHVNTFDASSLRKNYAALRPLIAAGHIRYVTEIDLYDWDKELSQHSNLSHVAETREMLGSKCSAAFNCFYVAKGISLPPKMNGAKSAVFVIGDNVPPPRAKKSHNKYIFLGTTPRKFSPQG